MVKESYHCVDQQRYGNPFKLLVLLSMTTCGKSTYLVTTQAQSGKGT